MPAKAILQRVFWKNIKEIEKIDDSPAIHQI